MIIVRSPPSLHKDVPTLTHVVNWSRPQLIRGVMVMSLVGPLRVSSLRRRMRRLRRLMKLLSLINYVTRRVRVSSLIHLKVPNVARTRLIVQRSCVMDVMVRPLFVMALRTRVIRNGLMILCSLILKVIVPLTFNI